ncbi:putative ATP-grasp-modified RiPP [Kitasatospora albolonga]
MSVLVERIPTLSPLTHTEPSGPLATRPFGLDALTTPVTVGRQPSVSVDPESQLSLIEGTIALGIEGMAGTSCNTESDGRDAIAIDTDQNDD